MFTVGIYPNTKKQSITNILSWLLQYLMNQNIEIRIPEDAAHELGYSQFAQKRELIKNEISFALTLGGDGTLLNAVRDIAANGIPVCGINMGQLGFLTEIELPDLREALDKIIAGNYTIEERSMLDAVVLRNGQTIPVASALNDVVITKSGLSRMIRLRLYLAGELTANYPADGLIVATSTGSTGYSLSAGGPIINPSLNVFVVTPICPHSLHARSLVVPNKEEIKITFLATHSDVVLTVDGQVFFNLLPEDVIIIKQSDYKSRFIKLQGNNYYQTLRKKFQGD